jgi:NADH dehydrogenase
MVSKDNYFLFTPMLHEVASGMIETRHIVTPIRAFCNRAKFYVAIVSSIDLKNRQVIIKSPTTTITTSSDTIMSEEHADPLLVSEVKKERAQLLPYDYLVIALGSETKFFGMADIEKHAFTIKSWSDAITIFLIFFQSK